MNYALFKSNREDRGGSSDDEIFPPGGEWHIRQIEKQFGGKCSYGPEIRDHFGWEFVKCIENVSVNFVIQCYGNDHWLVLINAGFLSNLFRRRSVCKAVDEFRRKIQLWADDREEISELRFFSEPEFKAYTMKIDSEQLHPVDG